MSKFYWQTQALIQGSKTIDSMRSAYMADSHNIHLKQENSELRNENQNLQMKVHHAEAEAQFYKELLCRPMADIAQVDENFAKTYQEQQELIRSWIRSSEVWREVSMMLAIEGGVEQEKAQELLNEANKRVDDGTNQFGSPEIKAMNKKIKE